MFRSLVGAVCLFGCACLDLPARAGDGEPEPLPPPKAKAPAVTAAPLPPEDLVPLGPPPLPYQRQNRYEHWQWYAVDRHGYYRPRVIYSPYGAYYLYSHEPYPWTPTHTLNFMPYVTD